MNIDRHLRRARNCRALRAARDASVLRSSPRPRRSGADAAVVSELRGRAAAGRRARARGHRRRPLPRADERDRQGGGREGLRRRAVPALPAEPRGRGEHPRRPPSTRTRTATRCAPSRPRRTPTRPPKWQPVSRNGSYRWFDHRIHPMEKGKPPQVKDEGKRTKIFDWDVPMTVGGQPVEGARHARVGAGVVVGHLAACCSSDWARLAPAARRRWRSCSDAAPAQATGRPRPAARSRRRKPGEAPARGPAGGGPVAARAARRRARPTPCSRARSRCRARPRSSSPDQIVFRFSEPVEGNFGAIRVFDRTGARVDAGEVFHPGGKGPELGREAEAGPPEGQLHRDLPRDLRRQPPGVRRPRVLATARRPPPARPCRSCSRSRATSASVTAVRVRRRARRRSTPRSRSRSAPSSSCSRSGCRALALVAGGERRMARGLGALRAAAARTVLLLAVRDRRR